ncbi:malto-oligosyltrehalose trehalohydrolase [Chondromyces crocatus]|uniref:Malto-oligosyltrehalose trehalohydrolase n=1 Tax=Chondromyces crocatus TaxID=52 RepID=A0A0K1ETP8_CHOCO|nr:malto-oligosyltrehalose trehalohydrolase [Chondromyces crocatus]AKT44164.1 1,4-alpha-glucan-branching protein [Chondromyces crocatus]
MQGAAVSRRLPVGAEPTAGGVSFRVWAPRREVVRVVVSAPGEAPLTVQLDVEGNGYFSKLVQGLGVGTRYAFRLDDDAQLYPDPASRWQPEGPHLPSEVVDPSAFTWRVDAFPGLSLKGQVLYEMHIGTFTPEGTWEAAMQELPALAALGITALEIMPIAEFPGRFGWGYDGVSLFAPYHHYGTPDDVRRFVDQAHALGLGVILDVVFNHLGPDGNYLGQFSADYFSNRYKTDWGAAINFDGERSAAVREFFLANAGYWIDEYRFDGLRIDATQCIFDSSPEHILADVAQRVRAAGGRRATLLIAENEPQDSRIVRAVEAGGFGLDALWNDDFHHSAMAALTGHNGAYYSETRGAPQELVSVAKWGYLYQGQRYAWQKQRRGTASLDLAPAQFVAFLQNHDQVANSARGRRVHALSSPGRVRALTAFTLLIPATPMLFQGQECNSSKPFLYFADHHPELATLVSRGRADFLVQFPTLQDPEAQRRLDEPADPATFHQCKLDPLERERNAEAVSLHRDLLTLRREDPTFSAQRPRGVDGAVLGPEAFVLRFFGERGEDRLLLVNLGLDLRLVPAPEPLLAPPSGRRWGLLWSSEAPRYGGEGTPPVETEAEGWFLPGHAAVVLRPVQVPQVVAGVACVAGVVAKAEHPETEVEASAHAEATNEEKENAR